MLTVCKTMDPATRRGVQRDDEWAKALLEQLVVPLQII